MFYLFVFAVRGSNEHFLEKEGTKRNFLVKTNVCFGLDCTIMF